MISSFFVLHYLITEITSFNRIQHMFYEKGYLMMKYFCTCANLIHYLIRPEVTDQNFMGKLRTTVCIGTWKFYQPHTLTSKSALKKKLNADISLQFLLN